MIGLDSTLVSHGDGQPGDTRERHIKYARALRERYPDGHISAIVPAQDANAPSSIELSEGLTAYAIASKRITFAMHAYRVGARLCRERSYDVVTTQTPFDDGIAGALLKRRFHTRLNVQMRSSFLDLNEWIRERPVMNGALNVVSKRVLKRADTIRVISDGEAERLNDRFPWIRPKLCTLHPLVNLDTFFEPATRNETAAARKRIYHNVNDNEQNVVLFVGRLVKQKNIQTALRAFAEMVRMRPNTLLVVAGDGPLRASLTQMSKDMGIDSNTVWTGNLSLDELRGLYGIADVTVMPSFHEGFGKVLAESYLMGTPVVAAPFISARELTPESGQPLIAPNFADHAWFGNNISALLTDKARAAQIGLDGRAHIRNYLLSDETYTDQLINIWEGTAGLEPKLLSQSE